MIQSSMHHKMKGVLICNWKMHGDIAMINDYMDGINAIDHSCDLIVAVPNCYINKASMAVRKERLYISSQGMHEKDNGPFTGSISASMIKDCGGFYAIIGHEELKYKSIINECIASARNNNINLIICVGGEDEKIIHELQDIVSSGLMINDIDLIIAYEPSSAIGGDSIVPLKCIADITEMIQKILTINMLKARIVYGGSVHVNNIDQILRICKLDGVMVGRAGLEVENVAKLCECIDAIL